MKIAPVTMILATILFIAYHTDVVADGLIHRLPKDGSWAQYDMTGEYLTPAGKVRATFKGIVKVKSVGQEQVDGIDCRWIEIEIEEQSHRDNGIQSRGLDDFKLLIPEKNLVSGQNPRANIIKAWRKDLRGFVTEIDLKGKPVSRMRLLEDLLIGSPANLEKSDAEELKVPGGTFQCTLLTGKESSESGDDEMEVQTWLTDDVPFGVAAYRHSKTRKEQGDQPFVPLGTRWVELKFAKSGDNAKSEVVPEAK